MKAAFLLLVFFTVKMIHAQADVELNRVEPPSWWVGMENRNLQLLVYGKNIAMSDVKTVSSDFRVIDIHKVENPNYLFIDFEIAQDAKPGSYDIQFFFKEKLMASYDYLLMNKDDTGQGFSTKDIIYLLMPDRFANGDVTNDQIKSMYEKPDRSNPDGRHGGDLKGIIDHLGYIDSLGMTTIWINPFFENNMKDFSYHGYAITDFYKTDPRLGSNELYKTLVEKAHARNLKVIMDIVVNHCGSEHWWMNDLPETTWIHSSRDYRTNYRGATLIDPHASQSDFKKFSNGWFVETMPDLNQSNPFLSKYLVQNVLWWIGFSNIDGLRMDTQPYADKDFVATLNRRIREEYPTFSILGEAWLHFPSLTSFFKGNSPIAGNYNSFTHTVTDFPLFYAVKDAFNEEDGWSSGLLKLYYVLVQDFLYDHPENNVIFLDNHDVDRFFTSVGESIDKFKMGIAFLFTTRGIPMLYYGDEILMTGLEHEGHGGIRKDFPGGWKSDKQSAFLPTGRTALQNEAFDFIKNIAHWRKQSKAVTNGRLTHFVPENNVYVYFRHTENEAVMVLLNNHPKETRTVNCNRFSEILTDYNSGKDIINGEIVNDLNFIEIDPKTAMVLELKRRK